MNDGNAARPGWVYLVGAGPGYPGLLTVRAAELCASADLVLHDQLVDTGVLALCSGEVLAVGKRAGDRAGEEERQQRIVAALVSAAQAGKRVVRLKGGDPFLFGRGSEEAQALRAAGIPFEVVPGVCAPLGATAYAGIPLTHRTLASGVSFVTAVRRDGQPYDWQELRGFSGTVCVFMGTKHLAEVCRALIEVAGRAADTPAAVVQSISLPRQRTVVATLADLAARAAGIGSPSLLVVGAVVALREVCDWYEAQPLFGKRVLVTRPEHQIAAMARLLRARGAEVLPLATIALRAPSDPERVARAVRELDRYDLVAFTSDNGVDWLWREIERQGRDARAFGRARVAAIGPATAAGLAQRGVRADVVAETFVAEQLAAAVLPLLPAGARVLLPRALVARETLPDTLRAAGHTVDVVPVYQTVSAAAERASELCGWLSRGELDVITLTSSSTVDKLVELLGANAAKLLEGVMLASIGPVTTATAERHGLRVAVTATVSTSAGLVDALERACAPR